MHFSARDILVQVAQWLVCLAAILILIILQREIFDSILKWRGVMNGSLRFNLVSSATTLFFSLWLISAPAGALASGEGAPNRSPGMKRGPMFLSQLWQNPQTVKELGLTDEQIKKLSDADFFFKEKLLNLKNEGDYSRLQMEKAFSAEKVNEEAVREAARKIAESMGELFIQHIELHLAIERLLTPEQREKLKVLGWGGRPMGMGPPFGSVPIIPSPHFGNPPP